MRARAKSRSESPFGPKDASCVFEHNLVRIDHFSYTCTPRRLTERREAVCDQLIIPLRGAWTKETRSGAWFGGPGLVVPYWRGSEYRYFHYESAGACLYFMFAPGALEETGMQEGSDSAHAPRHLDAPLLAASKQIVVAARGVSNNDTLAVEEAALRLASEVLMEDRGCVSAPPAAPATERQRRTMVARALEVCAARHHEQLTLRTIAREVGYSPFHLSREFSRLTGRSLYQTLLDFRVASAVQWIQESKESFEAIAHRCGFCNRSHLSRAVKTRTGLTPGVLRRGGSSDSFVLLARLLEARRGLRREN